MIIEKLSLGVYLNLWEFKELHDIQDEVLARDDLNNFYNFLIFLKIKYIQIKSLRFWFRIFVNIKETKDVATIVLSGTNKKSSY